MKKMTLIAAVAALLAGCASKKEQAKTIYERPWIGGQFKTATTPASVRKENSAFGRRGALVMRAPKETPVEKAGLQESDLVLAVNGARVHSGKQINDAVAKGGMAGAKFAIYRNGEVMEKTVAPGTERFEKLNTIALTIGASTKLEFDLIPNPNFSLLALGYQQDRDRMDLRDPKSKYLSDLRAREGKPPAEGDWKGLRSEEGWRFWLGPIVLDQRKMIVSQE